MTADKQKNHKLVVAAMLGAIATILQYLEFPIPVLIPSFVKMDFSELPALLASFSLGPGYGALVCVIKNLFKLMSTYSGGIGELGNLLFGLGFVIPAGLIYQKHKTRKGALAASIIGAVCMALVSIPVNYYITYPFYTKLMPIDTILAAYESIRPGSNGLLECLIVFNAPFTLFKGILNVVIAFFIYKPLSPLLHR